MLQNDYLIFTDPDEGAKELENAVRQTLTGVLGRTFAKTPELTQHGLASAPIDLNQILSDSTHVLGETSKVIRTVFTRHLHHSLRSSQEKNK